MYLRTALSVALMFLACARPASVDPASPGVDDALLRSAAAEPQASQSWLTHGRTWDEQRFSPLAQVNEHNVDQLGLAWSFDLETLRGVEATPLVADGTLYVTGPWSVVYALDATTGTLLWKYDPAVPGAYARMLCCGVINRGVALYGQRVFVGTLDGRLVALDRATGHVDWEVQTTDPTLPYSITGAPRTLKGLVIIGNGGADLGVRGYVSAYRASDGSLVWRTYTVPGNPAEPFESEALAVAAKTWNGEWWKYGGGGTAWDAMAYDPDLELLYVGTGNGAPQARELRSPGGGDNLYLASILALRPTTGELVWYFQTTPADNWDFTATQQIILADLKIDGVVRKVLMQAPKNGFFFVIDRTDGAFVSARPFVSVTWATGVDANGRPIENTAVDYREEGKLISPGPFGGHNWHSMSFNPDTGLVYIPTQDMPSYFEIDRNWSFRKDALNTGLSSEFFADSVDPDADITVVASLLAWDPVLQREAWRVLHGGAWNGGTLSTQGNLVFQGTADGRFVAYSADRGTSLWESPVGTGVMAAPITYAIDGVQYVAIAAGWGSGYALAAGPAAALPNVRGGGRMLVFKLGGSQPIPPPTPAPARGPLLPVPEGISAADLKRGSKLFGRDCMPCHGSVAIGGGSTPDLRYSSPAVHAKFLPITLGGTRTHLGMPGFGGRLTPDEVRLIQAYVIARGHESSHKSGPAPGPESKRIRSPD